MLNPDVYLPKTDFEWSQFNKGKAEGEAESILRLLELRHIAVSEQERARIYGERDMKTLGRWLDRVLSVENATDLFV